MAAGPEAGADGPGPETDPDLDSEPDPAPPPSIQSLNQLRVFERRLVSCQHGLPGAGAIAGPAEHLQTGDFSQKNVAL